MKEEDELKTDIKEMQDMKVFLEKSNFYNSVTMVKANLLAQFEATKFSQTKERDEVWRKLQSLDWVVKQLESVITTGEMAEKSLMDRAKAVIGM